MENRWSTQARIFVISVLLIAFVFFLVFIHELLSPLVVAGLLAFLLYPLATYLRRRTPLSQKAAGNLVFFLFLGLIALIPAVVMPAVITDVDILGDQLVAIIEGIDDLSKTTILGYELFSGVPADLEESITGIFRPDVIYESVAAVTENLVWVGVILIVMYYLLVDWPSARNTVFTMVPDVMKRDAYELFKRMRKIWNLYLRGQLSTMVILGLVSGVAAAVVGLPASIVLGLVAAALGLVPSVGSSVFAFIAGLVALFSRTSGFGLPRFWYVVIVLAVFFGIHLFENYWLRPKVLGQGLNMHPAVILVSVLGAITLGGGLLALIIVPLISSIGVLLQYILRKLSDADPWAEEPSSLEFNEILESE